MKKLINLIRHPSQLLSLVRGHREAGMATAEYAVGTVAVVGLGGIIWRLLTSEEFRSILWSLIQWIFNLIMGIVGG